MNCNDTSERLVSMSRYEIQKQHQFSILYSDRLTWEYLETSENTDAAPVSETTTPKETRTSCLQEKK